MRTLGQTRPFIELPWSEIAEFLGGIAAEHPEFDHMQRIAESVIVEQADDLLAGCTSMHDIFVVSRPIPDAPYDVVAVRAPNSLMTPARGSVRIEHLAITGRNDVIERPIEQTLPLFWRFMIEKFGVHPSRDLRSGS